MKHVTESTSPKMRFLHPLFWPVIILPREASHNQQIGLMDEAAATVARVDKSEAGLLGILESKRMQPESEFYGLKNNRVKGSENDLAAAISKLRSFQSEMKTLVEQYENAKRRR